jgi:sulfatase-like protein
MRTRAFIILGLSGLAVAQPLLDLFGQNPEFFVAGNYSGSQIVWFALLITLVPPLVGIGATALAVSINRPLGTIVFAVVVTALATAFVLALLRTLGLDQVVVVAAMALLAGAGVLYLVLRTRGAQLFASYLAVANVFFLGSFLFLSPASELVAGGSSGDIGHVSVPALRAPVVVVVLDEFAAATIMGADGSLNEERYPGFAELASVSTWFRNASSQYNLTHRAVPSILDGRLGDSDDLPTWGDHPRSLFTLLGHDVPIERYESVTDLCPPTVCEPPPRQPLSQAIEDASVVYGHRVLPEDLRDELPAIDNSWGAYGAADDVGADDELVRQEVGAAAEATGDKTHIEKAYAKWQGLDADERSPLGQAGVLRTMIAAIDGSPAVHFVHVALPHRPWVLSRTGVGTTFSPELITDPNAAGYEFAARMEYQLHSMQVGAADTLVGELVDHLRDTPAWDDTLLVVTSDHGTNLSPPDIGRMKVTDANREEVYRVPLFIKAPGQVDGEIRDDSVQNIDVLPSVVDLLGAQVDWEFDGHSLYDGSTARIDPKVSTDVGAAIAIAERRREEFPHGDDWMALAAVGANGDLVGASVADLDVGGPSEWQATLDQADLFDNLPTDDNELPFVLAGTLAGGRSDPPELLAAVNGTIAGVVGGYRGSNDSWTFTGYVADLYVAGRNEVELYEVSRDGDEVTLHPAI